MTAPETIDQAIEALIRACATGGGLVHITVTDAGTVALSAGTMEEIAALAAVGLRVREHGTDALGALLEAHTALRHIATTAEASERVLRKLLHD